MQPITKKALVILGVILVLLLALGALPGFLRSGDPYYLTAQPTNETLAGNATATDGNGTAAGGNATIPNAANLSDRSYQYTWQALRDVPPSAIDGERVGRSQPYWRGYVGFKEAFTHSPFDEVDAFRSQYPGAFVDDDALLVRWNNQTYRLALAQG